MRRRSSWLPRPLVVSCLAATTLLLSDGLPLVHATIPYYPYECPIGSGGVDFDGDGHEGTVGLGLPHWDPRNGLWFSAGQGSNPVWGAWGDIPTPGNFTGDGRVEFAIFRPSTGNWMVTTGGATILVTWGTAGDIPVPADYNQDGTTDYGVWRPSTGRWYVRSGASGVTLVNGVAWGQFGDCPIAANVTDGGPANPLELNVWRPANGVWYIGRSLAGAGGVADAFGTYGDIPFAPDMDSDGDGDLVVFRPSTGAWYGESPDFSITWGQPGDIPSPRSGFDPGSSSKAITPALTVYRPTDGKTYSCYRPLGSTCTATNVEGPSGSPGVVPLQAEWK